MQRFKNLFILSVLAAALATGCHQGSGTETDQSAARPQGCPSGWADASVVLLRCAAGYELEYKHFGSTQCVRCSLVKESSCNGPWKPIYSEIACAPGYEFDYNSQGTCKRCVPSDAECTFDSECVLNSNYCGGCNCEALPADVEPTTCSDPYQCLVDPCMSKTAVCDNGQCVVTTSTL